MIEPGEQTALEELRDALDSAGYTATGIPAILGTSPLAVWEPDLPVYLRRLPPGEPLSALIKLFLLGEPVADGNVQLPLAGLEKAGVIQRSGGRISPLVRITPWHGLLFASDPNRLQQHAESVLGVTRSSMDLALLTVRRPVGSALDLGTGCGVQALLAAGHADQVVAVDVNPRALRFTELSAALNRIGNVECLAGDRFEPVEGRHFDLVVSNPPYVLSPETRYLYRDGGLAGDELCRSIVTGAASLLHEGGFAHIACEWACRSSDEGWQPLASWLEGTGCDALVLYEGSHDPLSYAALWNEDPADPAARGEVLDRWLAYFEREGIARIGSGAVVLRRRSGPNWLLAAEPMLGLSEGAGEQVLRIFRAHDDPALGDDAALLEAVLAHVEPHRLEQTLVYRDGVYSVERASLILERGLGIPAIGPEDAEAGHVVVRLNGTRPLRDVVSEVAGEVQADPVQLRTQAVQTVRRLYELGFLERVDR